ncbi:MAG: site-specific DNA-methyltransferase [Candidatus Heimdallarchaeaceae archaeon]
MEYDKIYFRDCIEGMKELEDNSVDLIFADPPYNLQLKNQLYRPNQSLVDAVNDSWDKFSSFEEYDKFSTAWLSECKRVLKDTGSIWVIGTYHNIFRIGKIMQDLGFWILNDIIWIKTNPMPNFKGTRFNNAHETLIWAAKSEKSRPTFHYKSMKVFNDDKQMRSDWYLPICIGKERLKQKNGKKLHSTQKPEALLYRIILATSNVNDIVLDPFMGSGTTAAVAKKLKRRFIGFERNETYVKAAQRRLEEIEPLDSKLLDYKVEQKPPKVPFGTLVEHGFIKPGDYLYSKDQKYKAIVKANGSIEYNGISGSIHKISARILNKTANNGWKFWYIRDKEKMISIDAIRRKFAEENINQ